jgi:hypothetical protein
MTLSHIIHFALQGASIFHIHSIRGMDFLSHFNVISTVVSNHCHLNLFFYCFQMSIIGFPVQFHGGQRFIRKERLPLLPHVFIISLCEGTILKKRKDIVTGP